ncbi:hypothetical protein C8Q79DRAFT_965856 [Trametes meyenii]|nr:hypothetical protein C8Q79DRAFT_965856 [Trametes meyenii]
MHYSHYQRPLQPEPSSGIIVHSVEITFKLLLPWASMTAYTRTLSILGRTIRRGQPGSNLTSSLSYFNPNRTKAGVAIYVYSYTLSSSRLYDIVCRRKVSASGAVVLQPVHARMMSIPEGGLRFQINPQRLPCTGNVADLHRPLAQCNTRALALGWGRGGCGRFEQEIMCVHARSKTLLKWVMGNGGLFRGCLGMARAREVRLCDGGLLE